MMFSQSLSDLNSTTPTHVSVLLVCPFLPIKSVENWSPGTNSKHFKAVLINNHLNFAPLEFRISYCDETYISYLNITSNTQ